MDNREKQEIARLKAEAKRFRELAKFNRERRRALRSRPMAHRDPIEEMRCFLRANEYSASARERDLAVKRIRDGFAWAA